MPPADDAADREAFEAYEREYRKRHAVGHTPGVDWFRHYYMAGAAHGRAEADHLMEMHTTCVARSSEMNAERDSLRAELARVEAERDAMERRAHDALDKLSDAIDAKYCCTLQHVDPSGANAAKLREKVVEAAMAVVDGSRRYGNGVSLALYQAVDALRVAERGDTVAGIRKLLRESLESGDPWRAHNAIPQILAVLDALGAEGKP